MRAAWPLLMLLADATMVQSIWLKMLVSGWRRRGGETYMLDFQLLYNGPHELNILFIGRHGS